MADETPTPPPQAVAPKAPKPEAVKTEPAKPAEAPAANAAADATANAAASGAAQATQSAAQSAAAAGQETMRRATEAMTGFTRAAAERQTNMFRDFSRMFTDMRFPTMLPDTGVLMSAHRRNMDALSQANRLALEGAQAVARRHMEIMQQTMTELTEHVRELASTETPQAKAARQAELVKASYERAVANIKELSDLIQRSNGEALALLEHRFREAMDEIKTIIEKAGNDKAGDHTA